MRWTGTAGTYLDSAYYDGRTSAKQQPKRDTRCTTVVKRTCTNKALVFLFTRTSRNQLSSNLQQIHFHLPKGRPMQHHSNTRLRPNDWLQRLPNRRFIQLTAENHRPGSQEGYLNCAVRLECKGWQEYTR